MLSARSHELHQIWVVDYASEIHNEYLLGGGVVYVVSIVFLFLLNSLQYRKLYEQAMPTTRHTDMLNGQVVLGTSHKDKLY